MMSNYEKKIEELLRCPLCQHVLNEPRQLPCGHSLCKGCVRGLKDASSGAAFLCPSCQVDFGGTIELSRSYTLTSITEDFRQNKRESPLVFKVPCDCCRGMEQSAVKSCLKCEVSLCQEHVKDHEQLSAFRGHPLVNAVSNLSKRKCPKHDDEVLRYYCETSRRYMCVVCAAESQQKDQLLAACADVKQTLTENMNMEFYVLKNQLAGCINSISNLQDIVHMQRKQLGDCIKSISKLQDIVQEKKAKVTSLSFSSVTMAVLPLLLIVLFYAYHYSVENRTLQDTVFNQQKHMDRIFSHFTDIFQYQPAKVQSLKAMESEGSCRLDLDTAHNYLQVSKDLQRVERVATPNNYPNEPTRFTKAPQVMSIHCFTTGVHTWQVLAEGYWDIAVSYRSLDFQSKKGSTFGQNRKSWSLTHDGNGKLSAYHNDVKTFISGSLQGNQIGVTVDIERGNITFTSVEPTVARLHEFKAKLTEPVCLGLGLYRVSPASKATVLTAS